MLRKCVAHLRSQWMGALALFLVLTTGSAYALAGHNTVFSDDIVNREVNTADLAVRSVIGNRIATNAVKTGRVADDTLTGADVGDGALGGADIGDGSLTGGDLADGSVGGGDLADGTVTGDDVAESTLGRVPSAVTGGVGDWQAGTGCQPESATFVDCGFVRANIPESTRILVIGTIRGVGDPGTSGGTGFCRLASNSGGSVLSSEVFLGTGDNTTMVAVLGQHGPGVEDFGIECNEFNGGIQYNRGNIVTMAISPL